MPSTSDFSISLLAMLEDTKFSDAVPVLEALHEKGMLDLLAPVEKYTNQTEPLLCAWLFPGFSNGSYNAPRTRKDFERIERWTGDPRWLDLKSGFHKVALFDAWMSGHHKTSGMAPHHGDMLSYAPLDLLVNWSKPDHRGDPGAPFIQAVLSSQDNPTEKDGKHYGQDHIPLLVERGLKLTGKVGSHPVATSFTLPAHWDLFVSQGGDPQQSVKGFHDQASPLWRFLVDRFRTEPLGEHVAQYMKSLGPEAAAAIEKEAMDKYWKEASAFNPVSNIRSRKNWPQLHNSDGENVLFVLAKNERWQAFKEISNPKMAKPLLGEKDNLGRGIWYHIVQNGAESDIRAIVAKVPAHLDDRGQGLFLQAGWIVKPYQDDDTLLLPKLPKLEKWHSVTAVPSALAKNSDLWLAGPQEDQARVCDHMINGRKLAEKAGSFPRENKFLSVLAHDWDQDIGPHWRAVFCLNELCQNSPDWDWLDKQIDQGVTFELTAARAENLATCLSSQSQTVLGKMEAQRRQMKAGSVPVSDENAPVRRRYRP